jgi:hypothetical protein
MPLITVSPTLLKRVTRKEKVATTLHFTIGLSGTFNGKTVIPADGKVVLAVYDLDQYLSVQSVLPGGFREDDERFFDGTETDFPGPLQRHLVRPNSGVLFIAELEFAKRKTPKNNLNFFVKNVTKRQQQDEPAYEMRILTDTRVDDAGHDQPNAPIQLGSIGIVAAAREDFDDFSSNESTTRVMVFRLLTPDLTTVLLSTKNPQHSSAGVAIKRVLYSPTDQPKPIGSEHPCNDVKPKPGSRRPTDDPTGLYVEVLPDQDEDNPADLAAPAILWIHQVGRVMCGWYAPVRSLILNGKKPFTKTPIVPGDLSKVLSTDRFIFIVDVFLQHGTLKRKPLPKDARGVRNMVFCKGTAGELEDPDELVLFSESGGAPIIPPERQDTGLIRVLAEDVPFFGREVFRVQLSLDGTTFSRFRKIDTNSRLSWRAFRAVEKSRPELNDQRASFMASLTDDVIEPLPPGVWLQLTREVVSPILLGLVQQFINDKNSQQLLPQLLAEGQINTFLDQLAADLRLTSAPGSLPTTLQAQVRSVARSETINAGTQRRTVLSVLEEIAGGLLERDVRNKLGIQPPNPLPAGRPNDADYQAVQAKAFMQGFSAFDIRPTGSFTYKFTFEEIQVVSATLKRFVMLKGSVGFFRMKVDKLDAKTRQTFDPTGFPQQSYFCFVLGGSFGLGVEREADGIGTDDQKIGKAKPAGAPSPKPINCEVTTFLNLLPSDFDGARYVFFTHVDPNVNLSALSAVSISSGLGQETIFSITLPSRQPEVTLETVVGVPPKPLDIKGPDLHRIIEDVLKKKGPEAKVKLNAILFALTSFGGIVLFDQSQTPVSRDEDNPMDNFIDKPLEAVVTAAGPSFKKQCASLDESSRKFLDVCLAAQRRLLEYPGYIDIQGTASPEFGNLKRNDAARENRDLSLRRAQFVEAAIFAAAGSPGQGIINGGKEIVPAGLGSDTFAQDLFTTDPTDQTAGKLLDPFVRDQQANPAAYDKRLNDERKEVYPTLRRVDFNMNGLFTVRFKAE